MRLRPYPDITERWRKVCKHVFQPGEGWGMIFGDLKSWQTDWNGLRVAGVVHNPNGHLVAQAHVGVRQILDRNHVSWLAAAERAVDEAIEAKRVFRDEEDPARVRYVGEKGVFVVVGGGQHLVTCFRPRGARRSAVRRDQRHTSLLASARAAKRSDNDQR